MKTKFKILFLALSIWLESSAPVFADDLALAREFLYCGDLKMRVARLNKDVEKGKQEYKSAEELMLIIVAALIPIPQMDAELKTAQVKLNDDLSHARTENALKSEALINFVLEKKIECDNLQKEHGRELYKRGFDVVTSYKGKQPMNDE